ncbi:hypothetical protein FRC12_024511 [Ceratobasidium sp. 428]|nr:hypothetical protein FRC12_024511 [Ceratobasidium sp. 428]
MLLLNRASYLNLIAWFYRDVAITSTIQFNKLADTILADRTLGGRTSLRLLPCTLMISIPNRYDIKAPDTTIVMAVLHALSNIERLRLDLPSSDLKKLFQLGNLSNVPFKLQVLHCKTMAGMSDFLRSQAGITFFYALGGMSFSTQETARISAEPDEFLPKLRKLRGDWRNINMLIPNRPISCLTITHFTDDEAPETVAGAIFQASTPLVEFMDTRYLPEAPCFGRFVISWMNSLSPAFQSLERLTLLLMLSVFRLTGTPPSTVNIDADDIAYEQIELPRLDEPRLMDFQFWKRACPSLRFVTLFGCVLCDD